ncbi:restriction endonuclease [Stenotrophomonas sp. NPDC077659]|uniref:restriction endonuclease n=1 Tax=Stenotrophomonas sp. NPDC077659 TaxID=3390694 RepID=UPI003D042866
MLDAIHSMFSSQPIAFEHFAARIVELLLPDTISLDLTRPSRDGGRDAIGKYRVGRGSASVEVDFAMEAKCYSPSNSVGVKETSRLISRLRHRQFGVLITTSFVHIQAYNEIVDDEHPIIIIAGRDIVEILRRAGIQGPDATIAWISLLPSVA